ncbi:uncharacterized protein B0T23DRAFT_352845 [Neurospora hispaniola]|uniref:DNA repair metallo-beta-lactamase domain-containing protein n=1 Tax=Neurospora hispaniola TaxID=588809 RepID=A0AAJ0ICF0_9PEZI|nr:hypothetical protein B0T23DRAFT_352845 [Neurospora hispaniola]
MLPKSSSSSSAAGKLTSSSSKTPVKSARNKGYITKTPTSSKPKPKPNASILNYFKKAADETLFIGEGGVTAEDLEGVDGVGVEGEGEGEGGFEAEVEGGGVDSKEAEEDEKQFNDVRGSTKKRSLTSDGSEEETKGKRVKADAVEVKKETEQEEVKLQSEEMKGEMQAVPHSSGAQSAKSVRNPRRGPFLDDSDEEGEDEDEAEAVDESAAPVKSAGLSDYEGREKRDDLIDKTEVETLKKVTKKPIVPLLQQETSGARADTKTKQEDEPAKDGADQIDEDPQEDKENHYNDLQGEELREKRYVQEQARLEAEERRGFIGEDDDYGELMLDDAGFIDEIEDDDDLTFPPANPDAITESCPICNASLAGVTSDQATAHVNACLDGNPSPFPPPNQTAAGQRVPNVKEEVQESASLVDNIMAGLTEGSKRFASRAAVARPGQANPFTLPGDNDDHNPGPDVKLKGTGSSAFSKLMSSHAESTAWATAAAAESASRGMPAYKRTCPFYKIMPNFSICVDAFRYGAVQGCKAYFLSHFHSDHYMGLSASWVHGPIYCSKVTGSLVKMQLRTAAKYVVELEFGETVPVPETGGAVMVTMIEANHCPGSSLFLFEKKVGKEGRIQRILHCGDFRACPAHVEHPLLKPETVDKVTGKTKQQKIDVCYLDTTYLNPRYSFPPQEDVIQACAEVCAKLDRGLKEGNEAEWERLLRMRESGGNAKEGQDVTQFFGYNSKRKGDGGITSNPTPPEEEQQAETKPPPNAFTALTSSSTIRKNRLLVVCGTYSIGKERICVAIAQALRSKIFASPSKIRITKQLDDPELSSLMTADPREAQVHMQALGEIRADTLAEYLELHRSNGFSRIVGFRPSGWSYRPGSGSNNNNNSHEIQLPPDIDTGPPASVPVTATLPPSSLPTTHLLHGNRFRPRFFAQNVVPQRGSGREAMCFGGGEGGADGECGERGE